MLLLDLHFHRPIFASWSLWLREHRHPSLCLQELQQQGRGCLFQSMILIAHQQWRWLRALAAVLLLIISIIQLQYGLMSCLSCWYRQSRWPSCIPRQWVTDSDKHSKIEDNGSQSISLERCVAIRLDWIEDKDTAHSTILVEKDIGSWCWIRPSTEVATESHLLQLKYWSIRSMYLKVVIVLALPSPDFEFLLQHVKRAQSVQQSQHQHPKVRDKHLSHLRRHTLHTSRSNTT